VFASSPGQGSIAGGEKDQMIQVSATQTERTFVFNERDPGFAAEVLSALTTGGLSSGDEYFQIGSLFHTLTHRRSLRKGPLALFPYQSYRFCRGRGAIVLLFRIDKDPQHTRQ
jgi:hypothetical protein